MAHSQEAASYATPSGQFTAVDQARQEQRAYLLRGLDWQNALPGMQPAKQQIREALALSPGMTVLEIGFGAGDDARAMAERVSPTGHVTGIDTSDFMVEEARRRAAGTDFPLTFARGDVQRLDFADNTFDRCRCERVFQHVPDPAQAIRELVRVTKPGGRVVVADADWTTVVASDPITQAIGGVNARSIKQAMIGRNLGKLFHASGLQQISTRFCPFVVASEDYTDEMVELMQPFLAAAQAAGAISEADAAGWPAIVMQEGRDGTGFWIVPYFVVVGTKA